MLMKCREARSSSSSVLSVILGPEGSGHKITIVSFLGGSWECWEAGAGTQLYLCIRLYENPLL